MMTDNNMREASPRTTHIHTSENRGFATGFMLFVLGGVVAVLAILWFAMANPTGGPSSAPQGGDVNLTIESPAVPSPSESAAPAEPAPAGN
ncbi:hypothetical protein D2N39_05200 [Gemmobacter lutimaris]|uniref:Uncharacterized protein n=2 Tax=Gemmobacter lutimaris TaxID=2306023 RepID=A0A398BVV6_9RHOB|nr:hypothetical protein D2N39_05200 [Gemmobacter lutimaris]